MNLQLFHLDFQQQAEYLERFKAGDEKILNFIYQDAFASLRAFGLYRLKDEFTVTNIIHESFLKAWEFRDTMESMPHIYFFIRMNMKWELKGCYRNARYRFYRNLNFSAFQEEQIASSSDTIEIEHKAQNEERLQMIYKVIPYLPKDRQTITKLYFKYGLNCRQIARRFRCSDMAVYRDLKKSVNIIKDILLKKEHAKNKQRIQKDIPGVLFDSLQEEQKAVYEGRVVQQQSFEEIAFALGLEKTVVLQRYIQACKIIKRQGKTTKTN